MNFYLFYENHRYQGFYFIIVNMLEYSDFFNFFNVLSDETKPSDFTVSWVLGLITETTYMPISTSFIAIFSKSCVVSVMS